MRQCLLLQPLIKAPSGGEPFGAAPPAVAPSAAATSPAQSAYWQQTHQLDIHPKLKFTLIVETILHHQSAKMLSNVHALNSGFDRLQMLRT